MGVHQHQIVWNGVDGGHGFHAVADDINAVAGASQDRGRDPLIDLVVFGEKDAPRMAGLQHPWRCDER